MYARAGEEDVPRVERLKLLEEWLQKEGVAHDAIALRGASGQSQAVVLDTARAHE